MSGQLGYRRRLLETHGEYNVISVDRTAYPDLAVRAGAVDPGSSAGGEHPKFGAYSEGRHVLVKFAPPDDSAVSKRWRDLLWCEHTALEVVRQAGIPASTSASLDVSGWRFLEVERFDRVGPRGRRGILSLAAIDDEYFGVRDNWTAAASLLNDFRPLQLSQEDAHRVRFLDAFGQLIGNTDRHFGNLSFFVEGRHLTLAPAYDMLPMILAPTSVGLIEHPFSPAPPTSYNLDVWPNAASSAQIFFRQVIENSTLDASLRTLMQKSLDAVTSMAERIS